MRPHPPLSEVERKRADDIRFLAVFLVLVGAVFAVILAARGDHLLWDSSRSAPMGSTPIPGGPSSSSS
jgi:hypothetical protein